MSVANMAASTPRRSSRLPHTHTPKMSERKKGLFQAELEASRESLTKHRRLPVVDSESDSEDCDLGIISTLDSSSGEENDPSIPKTPERSVWRETRSQARNLLKENNDLKNFIKSPFTLKKYQTRCTGSVSTPATPHLQNHPGTPSSTHSCASVHTISSTSSRARKSLASLIADTESCSSSLKDLNFDTDSGTDSKENTPTKSVRRSSRRQKMTPKFQSFKGVLVEQKKNITPIKTAVVCLTKMDMSTMLSPTQMLKTPNNTTESVVSPPKIRRSFVEIAESPESGCDSEKSHKRFRNDSMSEAPNCKHPRLDVPKARLSLFNSDRLKEILSAKSFYGKSNPELNNTVTAKISHAIEASATHHRRPLTHAHSHKQKRKPGQINLGVKHRIRKPKHHKKKKVNMPHLNTSQNSVNVTVNTASSVSMNDTTMLSQNSSQELNDKVDPFQSEKQTIEALLSQWTEEEVPESELSYSRREELPCFNSTVIEETNQIFQPVTAVPVTADLPQDEAVIVELGAQKLTHNAIPPMTNTSQIMTDIPQSVTMTSNVDAATDPTDNRVTTVPQDVVMVESEGHVASHGEVPRSGQFLPVEGGYLLVDETVAEEQEELPDLDEIERELRMLDEQILKMAKSNNIDAEAVLKSTETVFPPTSDVPQPVVPQAVEANKPQKLFPIFSKPNPGTSSPSGKATAEKSNKKSIIKTGNDQYVIDAGQKKFGATQCTQCGTIYQIGDPQDEHDHMVYHNATDVLKYNGCKEECVCGAWGGARCVRVRGAGAGWRRVCALLTRLVHAQLGCSPLHGDAHAYTAYLYIEKKQIIGCLVVEPKTRAYKLVSSDPDCVSEETYPVKCGVSRIWVDPRHRGRGVARRLLDCARVSFLYGQALLPQELAFSAPTPAGKALAAKYCGTDNFYVYLD